MLPALTVEASSVHRVMKNMKSHIKASWPIVAALFLVFEPVVVRACKKQFKHDQIFFP